MSINPTLVKEGDNGKICCLVKDFRTNVQWYKNQQKILNYEEGESDKYQCIIENSKRELYINKITNNDEGDYICKSDNYQIIFHVHVEG